VGMVIAFFIVVGLFALDLFLRIVSHGEHGLSTETLPSSAMFTSGGGSSRGRSAHRPSQSLS
jgi:hypothetical protein